MTPRQFLLEQFENVQRALNDTLRYDYGPDETRIYYDECKSRLDKIGKQICKTKESEIWARLDELASLAVWISLIERSRLGEFSWPFAELIRDIAKPLFAETQLSGNKTKPIIHVISEGEGYQISYETISPSSSIRRFVVVAFPRPLKHHVLLHTIFGHELGHTAQTTNTAGEHIRTNVRDVLGSIGHLASAGEMTSWMHDPNAPSYVQSALTTYFDDNNFSYEFPDDYIAKWLEELICDLAGLLLFGPGFAAAHQVILRPSHRTPYEIHLSDPSHPPYAVRHKMLVRAMHILKWDQPVTQASEGIYHQAETETLKYILDDPYSEWAAFFQDKQLEDAIQGLWKVLTEYGSLVYRPPESKNLIALIKRLTKRLPPVVASICEDGKPLLEKINITHTLFAGWVYWLGKEHLAVEIAPESTLSFLDVNRLCDLALLQERGIDIINP